MSSRPLLLNAIIGKWQSYPSDLSALLEQVYAPPPVAPVEAKDGDEMQVDTEASRPSSVPPEVLKEPKWLAKCLITASLPPPAPPPGSAASVPTPQADLKPLVLLLSSINVAIPKAVTHKDRVSILTSIHLECIEWHCRSYLVSDRSSTEEKKAVVAECAALGRESMSGQPGAMAHLTHALSHLLNPLVAWALKEGPSKPHQDVHAAAPFSLSPSLFFDDVALVDATFNSILIPHLLSIDATTERSIVPIDLIVELLRLSSQLLKSLPFSHVSKHLPSCVLICQKMEPWLQEASSTLLPQSSSSSLLLNSCSILHHHALLFAATLLAVKSPQGRVVAQDHPTIALRVFEALLVRAQPILGGEAIRRALIREAVDIFLPALHSINEPHQSTPKGEGGGGGEEGKGLWEEAFSLLKRSLGKEDSYLVVVHCWQMVLRHADCFYAHRDQLLPSITPLASRLFTHPVS